MASSAMEEEIEISHELVPCYICGRTFLPCPLKKHITVCERNATRKRKIFDSLKQRVDGTDLAPFHQATFLKKPTTNENAAQITAPAEIGSNTQRSQSKWKEKHEELVQTIRAAKGEKVMGPRRSISAVGTMGVTERCPYCERQFGPKSYDRHVDWCKEHKNRGVMKSPANVIQAKERLEARTKYRVPPLNKSKRSITRDKYSTSLSRTESVVSVRSAGSSSVERSSPSVRRSKAMVATHHQHHSAPEPIIKSTTKVTVEKSKSSTTPDEEYNPFVVAEKQLMELLECDDFKPYNTASPPKNQSSKCTPPKSTTTTTAQNKYSAKTPSAKRSSIISPPNDFQDKMLLLQDNFELIENFINDNYVSSNDTIISQKSKVNNHADSNSNKTTDALGLHCILQYGGRKYSDDTSSIDPRLINETDNLTIPDKLPLDNYCSPTSSDHYSAPQYDTKISVYESAKNDNGQTLDDHDDIIDFDEFISSFDDDESFPTLKSFLQSTKSDKSERKTVQKSTLSLNSSYGKHANGPDIKKPITPLKRSVSLSNPVVKARSMKSKQDIQEYLHATDTNAAKRSERREKANAKRNETEPLFPPDHAMYEQYKKYKDLYRQEKNEFIADEKKTATVTRGEGDYDEISSNEDVQLARKSNAVKVSGDSAYGSLNRQAPKIQPRAASSNRHGLRSSTERSPSSTGSETSVTVPTAAKTKSRIPKFCHECGTKYPVDVAKFCVECGVKRLVL